MVSRLRFLRPAPPAPVDIDMQRIVYDLVLQRARTMFGPGASFAISIRTGDENDGMFAETIAETLAWDVSLALEATGAVSAGTVGAANASAFRARLTA